MENKISVIVPCYNAEKYLSRCLDSIINNSYKNLEIICINDGSSDNSIEILNKYAKKDARIKVIDRENGGVSVARNSAIDVATGDYIAFVDCDDWIHRDYFSTIIKFAKENNADVCVPTLNIVYDYNEKDLNKPLASNIEYISYLNAQEAIKNWHNKAWIGGKFYKRDLIKNIRFSDNMKIFEDTLFNLTVFFESAKIKIVFIKEPLYFYYRRSDSAVHSLPSIDYFNAANCCLNSIDSVKYILSKTAITEEAIKITLSYRYQAMVEVDKKSVRRNVKHLKRRIKNSIHKYNLFSLKDRIKYYILLEIPLIYYIFRAIDEPSMIKWWSISRKRRKRLLKESK